MRRLVPETEDDWVSKLWGRRLREAKSSALWNYVDQHVLWKLRLGRQLFIMEARAFQSGLSLERSARGLTPGSEAQTVSTCKENKGGERVSQEGLSEILVTI